MTSPLAVADDHVHQLAEGPVWDAERARLLWVDILAGEVHEGTLEGRRISRTHTVALDEMVGAVAPTTDGRLLVAAQEEVIIVAEDGQRQRLARIIPAGSGRRLNDGAVDPAGRFVVGTLALDVPSEHQALVRVERDASVTLIDDDLTLSNGLAWSTDGRTLFSVDTLRQVVYRRSYDAGSGDVGERTIHLTVDGGHPDGIALDAEAHLWVAVWGAGEVRRYGPDGSLVERLAVPAPHPSSVAFAGADLRTLVVTTATVELDEDGRRAHPEAGRLFTTRTDVPGLPAPRWRAGDDGGTPDPTERPT